MCIVLDNWVCGNFIWADEPIAKALGIFQTGLSINNSLCGKLVSSLEFPIKMVEVNSVSYFIPDFNLWSSELDKFTFKMLYWVILY